MDVGFCVDALKESITHYGKPEIFNTDQGSQFTSFSFTNVLKNHEIKISMDGKGRWMVHYNTNRPHSTFDGQTPHEVYMKMKGLNGVPHSDIRLAA